MTTPTSQLRALHALALLLMLGCGTLPEGAPAQPDAAAAAPAAPAALEPVASVESAIGATTRMVPTAEARSGRVRRQNTTVATTISPASTSSPVIAQESRRLASPPGSSLSARSAPRTLITPISALTSVPRAATARTDPSAQRSPGSGKVREPGRRRARTERCTDGCRSDG